MMSAREVFRQIANDKDRRGSITNATQKSYLQGLKNKHSDKKNKSNLLLSTYLGILKSTIETHIAMNNTSTRPHSNSNFG